MFPTVVVMITVSALVAHPLTDAPVEDWRAQPVGTMDVPVGWSELPLLQRALLRRGTLEIVEDEGQRALRLKTQTDQHTIIRKQIRVDLNATPVLEWRWKVFVFPTGADLRDRSRSDSPAVIALSWTAPPRNVSYAWDVSAPAESRFLNPKQSRVHYIVVRSGDRPRAQWLTERRDVVRDYGSVFGESPSGGPAEIELSVDSNDTRSVAETLIGQITFVAR